MTTASRTLRSSANGTEFSDKISELRALIADIAKSAPSAASETFDELKAKAAGLCDRAEEGINGATSTVVKTVKEHPAQVAIAAVGAGLLAWWLLSRGGKSE
ncbi:MAG TPA: hypothetical protein VHX44_06525 [Planctomycetota bacterium]|nr:hypothetical protein [Planctomycetota bacterium]